MLADSIISAFFASRIFSLKINISREQSITCVCVDALPILLCHISTNYFIENRTANGSWADIELDLNGSPDRTTLSNNT